MSITPSSLAFANLTSFFLGYHQNAVEEIDEPAPLSAWTKIRHIADTTYHESRIEHLAEYYTDKLTQYLRENPQGPPPDFVRHPLLSSTRKFLRNEAHMHKGNAKVKECLRLLIAAKIGVNLDIFEANPGFEEFATRSHLDRYLVAYKDHIEVDANNKVSLKYNNVYTPWETIQAELTYPPKAAPGEMRTWWPYGINGVQMNKDLYVWDTEELEPMFDLKNQHDWGDRHIFEFCTCNCVDNWMSIFTGVHAWFRVKTDDGKIYSFGLYRPAKSGGLDHLNFPGRTKKAHMAYEVSEFWPFEDGELDTLEIEITKEQCTNILNQIKEDKRSDTLTFQAAKRNCTTYARDLLNKFANLYLPTHESTYSIFNPKRVKPYTNMIPVSARKVLVTTFSIFSNLLFHFPLGASLVDKEVKHLNVEPHMTWKNFWRPEKSIVNHPYTLKNVFKWVRDWREKTPDSDYKIPPETEPYF